MFPDPHIRVRRFRFPRPAMLVVCMIIHCWQALRGKAGMGTHRTELPYPRPLPSPLFFSCRIVPASFASFYKRSSRNDWNTNVSDFPSNDMYIFSTNYLFSAIFELVNYSPVTERDNRPNAPSRGHSPQKAHTAVSVIAPRPLPSGDKRSHGIVSFSLSCNFT